MRSVIALAMLMALARPFDAAAMPAAAPDGGLFGMAELRDLSPAPLRSWSAVLQRIAAEDSIYGACETSGRCYGSLQAEWAVLLGELRDRPQREQLEAVGRFANRRPYRTDQQLWTRRDYWASPMEFLSRSGDCEDYAIFNYVSMRRLGMSAERLRLAVVQDTVRDVAHAVLAAHIDDEWLILDNLLDGPRPQRELARYVPYYSVNENARWMHVPMDALVVTAGGVAMSLQR